MIVLQLEISDIEIIMKGLHELPAKESMGLILKIDADANNQIEQQKEKE